VQPNAGRNRVVGFAGDVLAVKIAAPPIGGKANQELVKFLSKVLGIPKGDVRVERGLTGRNKMVTFAGLDRENLMRLLSAAAGGRPE
jgi:uncharacterized protein (TIGR00251 family)